LLIQAFIGEAIMSDPVQISCVLGIDIAKKTFQCALLKDSKYKHKSFANNPKGYTALSHWLKNQGTEDILHACLEATGVYGEALACYLTDAGFTVSIVNPAKIKGFAQCQLQRLKTDKADAKLIAQYCAAMRPKPWNPTPEPVRHLQALVKRLEQLGSALNQEQNRLDVASSVVQPSIQKMIDLLKQQIKDIQQQVQSHINQHPKLKQRAELLDSIPGIGPATRAQILAFLGEPDRFESVKQCVAFVGLNPKPYTSGTSVNARTRISKTGSSALRRAFYMPAIVAMKHNPVLQAFAIRLQQAGKKGKVIVCAVMRKLVHIIYGVLKSNQPFDANHKKFA
jgi:transposase